jgi:hypothetical protein
MKGFQAPVGQFKILHSNRWVCDRCRSILEKRAKRYLEDILVEGNCLECQEEYFMTLDTFSFRAGVSIHQYFESLNGNIPEGDKRTSLQIHYDVESAKQEYLCLNCACSMGHENSNLYDKVYCSKCATYTSYDVTYKNYHTSNHECNCTTKEQTKNIQNTENIEEINLDQLELDFKKQVETRIKELEKSKTIGDIEHMSTFLYRNEYKNIESYDITYVIRLYNNKYLSFSIEKNTSVEETWLHENLEFYYDLENADDEKIYMILEDSLVTNELFDNSLIGQFNVHKVAYERGLYFINQTKIKEEQNNILNKPTY